MASWTLYTASLVGAVALYLMLRPENRLLRGAGALLGLGALAWLAKELALSVPNVAGPGIFFYIFALIAVVSATRMITHTRPVYAALYFVMVVMSSAGLFLLLEAEFMAFALVIVYAGAILITYLFVLMLAQQGGETQTQAEYDVIPREPATAAMVGFVMLAVLSDMVVQGTSPEELGPPPSALEVRARTWRALAAFPERVRDVLEASVPGAEIIPDRAGELVRIDGGEAWLLVSTGGETPPHRFTLPDTAMPDNIQMVGLDLVRTFPASLELAGVILLLAMFGAVVLAQRQIELSDTQKQEAAKAGGGP